uniref:Uncharacterized protein n=1 Tax=Anguilla anguilla TaxID=7936 RepID=A0A0E9S408_ANGAN
MYNVESNRKSDRNYMYYMYKHKVCEI